MINIIHSEFAIKRGPQFRFPRSKKKRIRNKWAKRDENYRWEPYGYQMGDVFCVHPAFMQRLREEMVDQIQADVNATISGAFGPAAAMAAVPAADEAFTLERLKEVAGEVRAIARKYELMDLMLSPRVSFPTFPYIPS